MSFPNAAELARNLTTYFIRNDDIINRWGNVISSYQNLPGLVGFWPMSSVGSSTGNAYDLSGQSRTLTYNGNPTYNIYNNLVPYLDLDGTGDWLSRADEAGLRVTGTETQNAPAIQGMTFGGKFWFDSLAATSGIICKGNAAAATSSFESFVTTTGIISFRISTGAAYIVAATAAGVITTASWFDIVFTYDPSTKMEVLVNGSSVATQTVAVPAAIPGTARSFSIGAFDLGLLPMDGRVSNCFYSANLLPNPLISSLYQQSRPLFGV